MSTVFRDFRERVGVINFPTPILFNSVSDIKLIPFVRALIY